MAYPRDLPSLPASPEPILLFERRNNSGRNNESPTSERTYQQTNERTGRTDSHLKRSSSWISLIIVSLILTAASLALIVMSGTFGFPPLPQYSTQNDENDYPETATLDKVNEKFVRVFNALQVQIAIATIKTNEIHGQTQVLVEKTKKEREKDLKEFEEVKTLAPNVENIFEGLLSSGKVVTREDAVALIQSLINSRLEELQSNEVSMEDVNAAARVIVEDALSKHVADGIGLPDFALRTGGGRVLSHSQTYEGRSKDARRWIYGGKWFWWFSFRVSPLHPNANDIIMPRSGVPGECLPLKGSEGFVDVSLRTSIYPSSISLEHLAKDVAYDLSTSPKEFEVYGALETPHAIKVSWLSSSNKSKLRFSLLGRFRYEIGGSNYIQTFKLPESATKSVINLVRLKIVSNHGNTKYTCIYRMRVHGSTSPPLHSDNIEVLGTGSGSILNANDADVQVKDLED